jgi:hypothetical protein
MVMGDDKKTITIPYKRYKELLSIESKMLRLKEVLQSIEPKKGANI